MLCIICNKKISNSDTLLLNANGVHNECLNLYLSGDTPFDSERHRLEKSIIDTRKEREELRSVNTEYDDEVTNFSAQIKKLNKEKRNLNSTFSKITNMFNSNFNDRLGENENLIKEARINFNKAEKKRLSVLRSRKDRESEINEFVTETNKLIKVIYEKIAEFKNHRKDKLFEIYSYWLERPPDWESRREMILDEGSYCVSCGEINLLHIHHKRQVKDGGTHKLENLEVLCEDCHSEAHGGRKFRYKNKERETAYSKNYRMLQKAIEDKQPLMLHYQKYNGEKSQRVIHPKLIVRWGVSLLVESHDELRNEMRRFNLIRIKKLKPVK